MYRHWRSDLIGQGFLYKLQVKTPTNFNMAYLSRFKSDLAENLTALSSRQPPLVHTASTSPPKALHGFAGGLIVADSFVCGSNHTIWQLRKNQKYFDLEAGQHFVLTAVDAPGCWCPRRLFSFLGYDFRVVRGPPTACAQLILPYKREKNTEPQGPDSGALCTGTKNLNPDSY